MNIKTFIRDKIKHFFGFPNFSAHALEALEPSTKNSKILLGKMLASRNSALPDDTSIPNMEFQVFSQFGDDGIIQFLISHLQIISRTFIEFGVEDYREANTRFLLVNNRWKGLVFDGSSENIQLLRSELLFWYHQLQAKHAFITRENINQLIVDAGFNGELGILSIDLDGVDYWIWDAINVVQPVIVIVEYNSAFGPERCVTVPYCSAFRWNREGAAVYYWGASLGALAALADKKGYDLFGCNSVGNNAYFIRKDRRGDLRKSQPREAFIDAQFALGSNENGDLIRGTQGMPYLRNTKVYDVLKGIETVF